MVLVLVVIRRVHFQVLLLLHSGSTVNVWAAAVLVIIAAVLVAYKSGVVDLGGHAELRPLRTAKLTSLAEFGADYRNRMLWGSYRSGLYFGMRTRWVGQRYRSMHESSRGGGSMHESLRGGGPHMTVSMGTQEGAAPR